MSETPFDAPADDVAPPPPPNARPRSLTLVATFAAALGVLGLFGVAYGCVTVPMGLWVSSAFTATMPPDQAAAQQALNAASRPFLFVGLALFLAIIPLAVGLALGGFQVLTDKASGTQWLGNAFLFGLVVEPVRALLSIIQMIVLWDQMHAVALASANQPGAPPGTEEIMAAVVVGAAVAGQVVMLLWVAAKVALYAWGRRVLASDATQDWLISKA